MAQSKKRKSSTHSKQNSKTASQPEIQSCEKLADALLKHYSKNPQLKCQSPGIEDFFLETNQLTFALNYMRAASLVNIPDRVDELAKSVSTLPPMIAEYQQASSVLKVDGVLGKRTARYLSRTPHCVSQCQQPFAENIPEAIIINRFSSDRVKYFVHIENLPPVAGLSDQSRIDVVHECFFEWQNVCKINFQLMPVRRLADLVITVGDVHQTGWGDIWRFADDPPVLAYTDRPLVGQDNPSLRMTFDLSESFSGDTSDTRFKNVLCHELGHALGISHAQNAPVKFQPHDLMYGRYQSHIDSPQSRDIQAAQSLWGAPPPSV